MSAERVLANRYELTEVIDQGGMGDLFKGFDRATQTPVAIKALKPEVVADDPSLLRRFEREAAILTRLNHPNIVRVLDTFSEDGRHYQRALAREKATPLERQWMRAILA